MLRHCQVTALCVALVIASAGGRTGTQQPDLAPDKSPSEILIQSYLVASDFTLGERAFYLVRLGESAASIEPVLARLWAEEAFQLTFRLPKSHDRLALQKNALVNLVKVDARRALELFGELDDPVPVGGVIHEDVRADGARTVFPVVWKKLGDTSGQALREHARHLGDTGQFPYSAFVPILRDVAPVDAFLAESIFLDAQGFYTRGSVVRTNHEEFARFVSQLWGVLPRPLTSQALRLLVQRLTTAERQALGETYLAHVHSEKGAAALDSEADRLLLGLLPLIRAVDPNWAERLLDERPALRGAVSLAKEGHRIEDVVIRGQGSPSEVESLQRSALERNRLGEIEKLADSDAAAALALSASLMDASARAAAYARVAAALHRTDPARASRLLEEATEVAHGVADERKKVKVLTAITKAHLARNDKPSFRASLKRTFALATELIQQDLDAYPTKAAIFTRGFPELSELVRAGARLDPEHTLPAVQTVREPRILAHLLIDVAVGLDEARKPNVSL
ncbi:MAG: hypothetical protein ACRD5F_09015 [Candidatus Acidiferrales bacterium]